MGAPTKANQAHGAELGIVTPDDPMVLPDGASIRLVVDGSEMTLPLTARDDRTGGRGRFSSGSAGYHGQTKVDAADGRRYQVGITATLIGSKPAESS